MTSTVTTELDTEYAQLPEPRATQTKSVEQPKKTVSFQLPSADESQTSEEKTIQVMDKSSYSNLVNTRWENPKS